MRKIRLTLSLIGITRSGSKGLISACCLRHPIVGLKLLLDDEAGRNLPLFPYQHYLIWFEGYDLSLLSTP